MKTKLFTFFLALAASVGTMFPEAPIVVNQEKVGDLYYNLNRKTKTAEVTYYGGKNNYQGLTTATIPSTITYKSNITYFAVFDGTYQVTSIEEKAFHDCVSLTSVTIPNSVTSIGRQVFYGCTALESIDFGDGITSFEDSIFYNYTNLTSVRIGNKVKSIGTYAFYGCSGLTSVAIGNKVTNIGNYAFYGCSGLTSVTIPNSVTSIGNYAFSGCTSLTNVTIGNSVTSIGGYAFWKCSSLKSISIPNSVTSFGGYAFYGCSGLKSINISDLAAWCNLTFASLECNPLYYARHLYLNNTEIKDLIIPDNITNIGNRAFCGCTGLTSVTIPNSVKSIGEYSFAYCTGLPSATIGDSVTIIRSGAFYKCTKLTSIEIPNSVTSIESGAFWKCSGLKSVTIGGSVTSIGSSAFLGCSSLTSVTIPNSVTSIGFEAFYNCTGLTSITSGAVTPPTCGRDAFGNVNKSIPLYVPAASIQAYKTADAWKEFTNIQAIGGTYYIITFNDWNGNVLQSTQVEEGDIPQYTGATPTRSDDEYYTYEFSRWTPEIVAVSEDAIYTATYNKKPKEDLGEAEETDDTEVTATPTENYSVIIEWPAIEGATTYTINIYKNGELVCTLVFNEDGQLIAVNQKASVRGIQSRKVTSATQVSKGWKYTITGLEASATYTYTVTAKDSNDASLFTQSIEFTMPAPQGIEDIESATKATKIIREGQVLIQKGEKVFDLRGQEVK